MRFPRSIRLTFIMLAGTGFVGPAAADVAPTVLATEGGRRCEFVTQLGHAYQVQAEIGGGWQAVGEVVFGTGGSVGVQVKISQVENGERLRVVEVNPATVGMAPAVMSSGSLSLVDHGSAHHFVLLSADRALLQEGLGQAASYAYTYHKSGPNSGQFLAVSAASASVTVDLTFLSTTAGTYRRKIFAADGQPLDDDAGTFAISPAGVWTEGAATWGATMTGTDIVIEEGAIPARYVFGASTVTRMIPGQAAVSVPYVFEKETPDRVALTLEWGGGRQQELRLTLLSTTGGSYQMKTVLNGTTVRTATGSFSQSESAPAPVSTGFNCPPNSLVGLDFDLTDVLSGPLTLDFDTATEGTRVSRNGGTIEFTPFTYNYSRKDDTHARLLMVYPGLAGDEVEQVDLTFHEDDTCTGTFVRKTYRNGTLVSTTTGTFGPGQPPPLH